MLWFNVCVPNEVTIIIDCYKYIFFLSQGVIASFASMAACIALKRPMVSSVGAVSILIC